MNSSTIELINIKQASRWASEFLEKNITTSNISYLIQYGRIKKYGENGSTLISVKELEKYYSSYNVKREKNWNEQLGNDLNWALSFEQYKESETTKHVHRLHPYKGKFIPQLVEYFLDEHIDEFKEEIFFRAGDIVLDPFSGSGTTMVQAAELGINAVGIDVSEFNSMIGNCKVDKYDIILVQKELAKITSALKGYLENSNTVYFEEELLKELYKFNLKNFPVPEYKYKLRNKEINEKKYGAEKETEFLPIFNNLVKKYEIQLKQKAAETFLDKWYSQHLRNEINLVSNLIGKIEDTKTKRIVKLILSRTIRSCRATTHSDLATIYEPIISTYYCSKHGKICKPLFSILKWWETYSQDTVNRLQTFDTLRTNTFQHCITGDSRIIDIIEEIKRVNHRFATLISKNKISGIFSSPPYVGLIDYHEQHAYAYDLFGFKRQDELEIGPLSNGQSKEAKNSYVKGISEVLVNTKKYFREDYNVFLVANDKYNLYPTIAENAGMIIANQHKRPVLNRTEKDKGAYSELIFHLKEKG